MKKRRLIIITAAVVLVLSALAVGVFYPTREGTKAACDNCHAWGKWSSVSASTCTEGGKLERICTLCGEIEARDSSPSSHILSDWEDNGQGKYIKTCTLCREIIASEEIYTEYSKNLNFARERRSTFYRVSGIGACKDAVVVIPPEINGSPVREIDSRAFSDCKSIKAVIIPSSVTRIGSRAFAGSSVERVFISDSVTSIGDYAFSGCIHLESLVLPNSLTWLGQYCFSTARSLSSLIFPQGMTEIPQSCFANSSLISITIPSSVTSIGNCAFKDCRDLISVNLPDSLTEIDYEVFSGCSALPEIFLPDSINRIDESAFADCTSLASISWPVGLHSISAQVFKNCSSLETVYIPSALTAIHETAFLGISNDKTEFLISPENKLFYAIGTSLIKRDPTSVTLGNTLFKRSPDTVLVGSADGSIPTDPRITKIGGCAFKDRLDLRKIVIPKNITSIGGGAFLGCRNVTSITYEGTVAEWEKISLGVEWFSGNTLTVKCSDGNVKIG